MSAERFDSKLAVLVATVAVSTSAILIRYTESGPLTIAFYRLLFTSLMLLPWFVIRRSVELKALRGTDWIKLASVGLVLAAHFAFWIASVNMTTIANSVVLVSTHPLMVALIATLLLKETPSRIALAGGLTATVGVLLLFAGEITMEGLTGNLFALVGALAAGFYIVAGRSERKRISTVTYCFVVYGFCSLFLAPLAFIESGFRPAARGDWYLFFAMALVPGILGHTMYNYALRKVPAFFVSTALVGEPLLASIFAWLLLSEIPSGWSLIGAPLILAGILFATYATKNA